VSPPGRGIVPALAVTQTVGYGVLFYAYSVLLVPLSRELNASTVVVAGALTANIACAALLGVPIGHLLDRGYARLVMTTGSVLAVLGLVGWAMATDVTQLYLSQIVLGVGAAATLYEAAFAVVVATRPAQDRPGALLAVTVAAGFASTVFLPLTGWLSTTWGWRAAVLALACGYAATVPLHARFVPGRRRATYGGRGPGVRGAAVTLKDPAFWVLALALTANAAAVNVAAIHLVSALVSWGRTLLFASVISGLLGVLSVMGRVVTVRLNRRFAVSGVVAVIFGLQGVAAVLLPASAGSNLLAVIAVAGIGVGAGVATIAKPLLLLERYDVGRFATLGGILALPMTAARAAAPLFAAALQTSANSYVPVFRLISACCIVAAVATAALGVLPVRKEVAAVGD
jgi:predicted MFS family arabinose efflux permease